MWFKNYKKENEVLEAKLEIANKKIKSIEEYNIKNGAEWVKEKSELQSEIGTLTNRCYELEKDLDITEKRRRILAGANGGYKVSNKNLKEKLKLANDEIKTLVKSKEKVDKDYKKYFDLYNTEVLTNQEHLKTIDKLEQAIEEKNQEIKELNRKLELKENPVTIQELKEYQMFGKPRRRAKKSV